MLFSTSFLNVVIATLTASSMVSALPARELTFQRNEAAQAAINWGANTISRIGDTKDPVKTMTQWDWADCGSPDDVFEIDSVSIKPDPPVPGKNLTVYASGKVRSLVTYGAYADVVVKLGLIKLLTKRFDLCDELDRANSTLECPIKSGRYDIEQTVALPNEIPRAKFNVNANVYDQNDMPAACVNLWINFLLPDRVADE